MRILHLSWPHLPLRLERASRPVPDVAILGGHPWEPLPVLDCTPAARRLGIRRGMSLGAAHALAPDAAFLVPDPDRYRAAAEAALDALAAFAPYVEGDADPASDASGGAYLGIDGLGRLWGDEPVLLARLAAAIAPHIPGPVRAGIAGSRFAAVVAAVIAREPLTGTSVTWLAVPAGDRKAEVAFLAPLPVTLLPGGPETQDRLRVLGIRRIGEFAALPRAAVVARFGAEGAFLHDLATGRDGRRIVPRRPPERLRGEAELEPPVDSLESLRFVLHRLADALCGQLTARGAGATVARLEVRLEGGTLPVPDDAAPDAPAAAAAPRSTALRGRSRSDASGARQSPMPWQSPAPGQSPMPRQSSGFGGSAAISVEQPLPGPTAQPEAVERLLLARLEAAPPPGPVERLVLELDGVVPAAGRQLGLFEPQAARAARLEWQLADLAIRFGEGRVLRARLRDPDAPLPEERVAWTEATADDAAPDAGRAGGVGTAGAPGTGRGGTRGTGRGATGARLTAAPGGARTGHRGIRERSAVAREVWG